MARLCSCISLVAYFAVTVSPFPSSTSATSRRAKKNTTTTAQCSGCRLCNITVLHSIILLCDIFFSSFAAIRFVCSFALVGAVCMAVFSNTQSCAFCSCSLVCLFHSSPELVCAQITLVIVSYCRCMDVYRNVLLFLSSFLVFTHSTKLKEEEEAKSAFVTIFRFR